MSFVKASSIEVPDIMFKTKKTGCPEFDKTFSDTGGLVPSQVILATGKPGSGKTTISLLAAAKLNLNIKQPGAFVSLEMSDFQLAHSAKKIPGFGSMMVDTTFSLKPGGTLDLIREMKPSVVIIDSLQKAAGLLMKQGESPNFNQAQKDITDAVVKFAKETFIPFILIGHMTKSGQYVGPSHLEHEVDSHMHVEYDQELNLRTFWYGKNRFGGSVDPQLFGISAEGVWLGSPYVFDTDVTETSTDVQGNISTGAVRLRQVLEQFRKNTEGKSAIGMSEIQLCSKEIIDYLKVFDRNSIITNSHIKDPNKVRLTYKHKGVAHCVSKTGEIQFGDVMGLNRFAIGTVGYKKEQPFIRRNCKTREDLFVWVVVHEWTHLKNGQQNHYITFFQEVEKLYQKMMASITPNSIKH